MPTIFLELFVLGFQFKSLNPMFACFRPHSALGVTKIICYDLLCYDILHVYPTRLQVIGVTGRGYLESLVTQTKKTPGGQLPGGWPHVRLIRAMA